MSRTSDRGARRLPSAGNQMLLGLTRDNLISKAEQITLTVDWLPRILSNAEIRIQDLLPD
jgi:hypothetical protein